MKTDLYSMSRFVEIGVTLHEPQVIQLQALLIALVNATETTEFVYFKND